MAGDWIKMRTDLRNHPKVVRIASALKADRLRVIGGLWSVWSTFDTHSVDGTLEGYTLSAMDDDLGWRGFAAAMQAVGWLEESESGLVVPRFEDHNGASAKRRALDNDRKKSARKEEPSANGSWTPSGQVSASDADKARTRVREDREKKEIPPTPKGEGRFPEFWEAWPKSPRKVDRKTCAEKWVRKHFDGEADAILAHVKAMAQSKQWQDGYEPAPLTYLNRERWRDGIPADGAPMRDDLYAGVI